MQLKDYVVVEEKFRDLLWDAWHPHIDGIAAQAERLINEGEYDDAIALVSRIDVQSISQEIASDVRRMAYVSLTLGAMLAKGSSAIKYKTYHAPPVLEATSDFVEASFANMKASIIDAIHLVTVNKEVAKSEHECCSHMVDIVKAAPLSLADRLNAAVMDQSKSLIDIAANASTTRLVGLGWLDQAQHDGIKEFQITSALDGRVCPVCRTLHGKVFVVGAAYEELLTLLKQSDPAVIKVLSPWPSQSKASVASLRAMSPEQLQGRGLSNPPYHGGCRCRQVLVGTVPIHEILEVATDKPSIALEIASYVSSVLKGTKKAGVSELSDGTTVFQSAAAATKWADSLADAAHYSVREQEAIKAFTGPAYADLANPEAKVPEGMKAHYARLVKASNKVLTDKKVVLFQGIGDLKKRFGTADLDALVGKVSKNQLFSSTSPLFDAANKYAAGYNGIVASIELPAGTPIIAASKASTNAGTAEMLLPPGLKIEVVSVSDVTNSMGLPQKMLHLRVVL